MDDIYTRLVCVGITKHFKDSALKNLQELSTYIPLHIKIQHLQVTQFPSTTQQEDENGYPVVYGACQQQHLQ